MNKALKWIFYLFLLSLPFGTRYLVYQFTPGFNEYASVWLYGNDIVLIAFILFFWLGSHSESAIAGEESYLKRFFTSFRMTRWLGLFLITAFASIFYAYLPGLAVYNFLRLLLLVLMALAVGRLVRDGGLAIKDIFLIIAASAVFQALLGLAQFFRQASLGLKWLGEPVAAYGAVGPAKIIVEGAKILRPFGTFPHANIFGAFLVLGLISLLYFFIKFLSSKSQIPNNFQGLKSQNFFMRTWSLFGAWFLVLGIFVVMLGLVISFSRSAWIVGGLMTLLFLAYNLVKKEYRPSAIYLSVIVFSILFFLLSIFSSYIIPRAELLSSGKDVSVSDRLRYTELGLNLVKENPLGVGIGNQVFYSVKNGEYLKLGMDKVWLWEPVHNLYLLIASEIGILGFVAFCVFIFSIFINWKLFGVWSLELGASKIMFLSLLLLGLFDHYLWTLQPGRLMLWLTIGLVLGLNEAGKRSSFNG